jgi:uncharacterized protein (DUF1330 family)
VAEPGIDRFNEEAFAAFGKRLDEGPVYMLNLLEFLPDGGEERYMRYGEAVTPLLEKVGGRPIFAGRPSEDMIGDGHWDLVVIAEYPTRQAFIDMATSPEYQEIAHLRTEALRRAELRAMDSIDL